MFSEMGKTLLSSIGQGDPKGEEIPPSPSPPFHCRVAQESWERCWHTWHSGAFAMGLESSPFR